MNVIIVLDVSGSDAEVRTALINNGYYSRWSFSGESYNLPKSCLWKPNTTLEDVKSEVHKVVSGLPNNITIQRLLVLSASPWEGIMGEKVS